MNSKKMKQKTKTLLIEVLKAIAYIITAVLTTLGVTSCGVTKATISKPAEGTQTTITITTNNPISTNVTPNVELKTNK